MRRWIVCCALAIASLSASPVPASAQKTERDIALELFDAGKRTESLPLLEKWLISNPTDWLVLQDVGFILLETSGALPDPNARKQQRARARTFFARAVQAGSKDLIVKGFVDAIAEDGGSDAVFSDNKEVNDAMQKAEAAYSGKDYRLAFTNYQRALTLDPTNYSAALFSGDVYLHVGPIDSAYIWYARATEINPYRETAFRYWSDVLTKNNKIDEAGDKAIDAVVAEPFSRLSRQALTQWAPSAKAALGLPLVALPSADTAVMHTPAGMAYDSVRRAWKGTDGKMTALFVAQFPKDTVYRHSVVEEKQALQAALKTGAGPASMANLKAMDDAGVLEGFIFFVRADAGIAKDYPEFVRTNREKLKKFWAEFVIGAKYIK